MSYSCKTFSVHVPRVGMGAAAAELEECAARAEGVATAAKANVGPK